MKIIKDWEKEVNKILAEKVETIVKKFKEERAQNLIELATLSQKLEDLEKKTTPFLDEKKGLNTLINKDLARWNYLNIHIPWLQKQVGGIQNEIEKIVGRLTDIPDFDSRSLNVFSRLIDLKS